MYHLRKLTGRSALAFVLLFGAIGAYLVTMSFAATTVRQVEAESMTLTSRAAPVDDPTASAQRAVRFLDNNAVASTTLPLPAKTSSILMRAKGNQCQGAPQLSLVIDGVRVTTLAVSATSWTSYPVAKDLSAGSHTIAVGFTNDYVKYRKGKPACDRDVYVDNLVFVGTDADTTPPTPATLTGTAGDQTVQLSWAAATDNASVAKYEVWKDNGYMTTLNPSTQSYQVGGLTNGSSYAFRVVAYDTSGNYANSQTVSVTPTATSSPPPAQPPSTSPSGQPIPTGDVTSGGHTWRQIVAEDFTKDAPLGSWANSSCTNYVVYTGATGTPWKAYPSCYRDTYQSRPYRSDKVLSVHDGVLDNWLHLVDGKPAGANPGPVLPTGSEYQTYGRYSVRFRTTTNNLGEYYQAWLLWPQQDKDGACAESDYPESKLDTTYAQAFAHWGIQDSTGNCAYATTNGTPSQDYARTPTLDRTQWHTYTQEWLPGARHYYLDGALIGTSSTRVWDRPERWQLQTETNTTCDQTTPITCNNDGHLLIDWAVVYAY